MVQVAKIVAERVPVSGLPRGVPPEAYGQVIRLVQGRGARAVLAASAAAEQDGYMTLPQVIEKLEG